MSDTKEVSVRVGPGGLVLLTIVFVLLKAFGKIDWSWLWVFSPMWIPFVLFAAIATIAGLLYILASFMEKRASRKRLKNLRRN